MIFLHYQFLLLSSAVNIVYSNKMHVIKDNKYWISKHAKIDRQK